MKKALFLLLLVITLFYACSKNSPTSTPNVEQTVGAVLTAAANDNATQTQVAKLYSPTISPTITITSTATASPNMTQTIGVILTAVGADNATATEQAREAATAAAGLYTATLTSTITPSPNQTATAAAIGTMIADIYASETEAVILSRTPTPTATPTITATITETATPTITATITETATPTITATITETATPTITATITETATPTITSTSTDTPIPYSDIVTVPGGTFTQIDGDGTSSFSHTISTFKIGKYQVTYNLWYVVYQWAIANGYTFANSCAGSGYTPVTNVSWRDVIVWCNAYSQEAGLTPCYTYASAVIKNATNATACDNAVCAWTNNGYRLPSDGEYQYAARYIDGTNWTPYNYASGATADSTDVTATGLVAWYSANCSGTQAVGGKTANALGIYDMSGNVWEWCWDWYGTYPTTVSTDYRGSAGGSLRVIKGGSFIQIAGNLQVDFRAAEGPYYAHGIPGYYDYFGFRFARTY